jgi:hypothetical protein
MRRETVALAQTAVHTQPGENPASWDSAANPLPPPHRTRRRRGGQEGTLLVPTRTEICSVVNRTQIGRKGWEMSSRQSPGL